MKLENKQIGVLVALVLAVIMLFLPGQDGSKLFLDTNAIAKMIVEKEDQISPRDLSEWIIENRNDYQLVDIRSEKEYDAGHIKSAENIPLKTLLTQAAIEQELSDDKIVVLYSNGNSHAHQAWLVLNSAGKSVYALEGGYNSWNNLILNPKKPLSASDDEILQYKAVAAVAKHFGGSQATVQNTTTVKPKKIFKRIKKKKKKLEGC